MVEPQPPPSYFVPPQNQPASGVSNDPPAGIPNDPPIGVPNVNEPAAAGVPMVAHYPGAVNVGNQFNDPIYQCCCGCMHVKTGAIVFLVLEVIGILALSAAGVSIYLLIGFSSYIGTFFGLLMFSSLIAVICLPIGLFTKKRCFLIIYMVFRILFLGSLLTILIAYINSGVENGGNFNDNILPSIAGFGAACFIETIHVSWAIYVVFKCYLYFYDLNHHQQQHPQPYQQPYQQQNFVQPYQQQYQQQQAFVQQQY